MKSETELPIDRGMKIETLAVAGLRLFGVIGVFIFLWCLVVALATGMSDFNPTYIGYFFIKQLLSPLLGLVFSILLFSSSRTLGKWIAKGLD